jgi:hypothetical protein
VRCETILDVLTSTLGLHGYRSQRLVQDGTLWQALHILLSQRRGSLFGASCRFVRTLLHGTARSRLTSSLGEFYI